MAAPSPAEHEAFLWMQGRMVELLLRHDAARFGPTFAEQTGDHETLSDPLLERYRELAVLFYLRDELFLSILPRIKRRLSFSAPRETQEEELPSRGHIDWPRTLAAGWRDLPGRPPLEVVTRQRRRHFATPENLLTVATILEYRMAAERLLDIEASADRDGVFRHPLNEIIHACTRELVFLQFAGLVNESQEILAGYGATTIEDLAQAVEENLLPGRNSAYDDLLAWRRRLESLRLLDPSAQQELLPVIGATARDNYLYQIWIFYEVADLLAELGRLRRFDGARGRMRLEFQWGEGDDARVYRLQHDQAVPAPVALWSSHPDSGPVPGVRPDFYLERIDPPAERIEYEGRLYWREPGIVWDAKYYREPDTPGAPSAPVKRMIADLNLLGETYGTLLFAFLKESPSSNGQNGHAGDQQPDLSVLGTYRLTPAHGHDQTIVPQQEVTMTRLLPPIGPHTAEVRQTLLNLLDQAHQRLRRPRVPGCHGMFLDSLSANEQSNLVDRYGRAIHSDPSDLLLCPKPHIGPWRVDLVSRQQHCCEDPWICQIIHLPGSRKPIRPPRTAGELLTELQQIFASQESLDEEHVSAIARQVEQITRRFADIAGAYRQIHIYYQRLRDLGMDHTLDLLAETEKESLALAVFLVEQLDSIQAHDYSAPAIHISSVMEREVQRSIFRCPTLQGLLANPKKQTLGTLPYIRRRPEDSEGNWQRIVEYAAHHWHGRIDTEDPEREISFDSFIKALDRIAQLRNKAAHTDIVSRKEYSELQKLTCQSGPLGDGALNILLLAWR